MLDAKRGPNVQELAAGGPKPEKEPEHPKNEVKKKKETKAKKGGGKEGKLNRRQNDRRQAGP